MTTMIVIYFISVIACICGAATMTSIGEKNAGFRLFITAWVPILNMVIGLILLALIVFFGFVILANKAMKD